MHAQMQKILQISAYKKVRKAGLVYTSELCSLII